MWLWCLHLCVYRRIYPCLCGSQRRLSGVLPYHSPSKSLTETWSKAGSQQTPEILLPPLPQHWGYKSLCAQSHSAFYVGAADLNLGFQSCAASVLTHRAMSSTSLFISCSPLEDVWIHFSHLKSIKAGWMTQCYALSWRLPRTEEDVNQLSGVFCVEQFSLVGSLS